MRIIKCIFWAILLSSVFNESKPGPVWAILPSSMWKKHPIGIASWDTFRITLNWKYKRKKCWTSYFIIIKTKTCMIIIVYVFINSLHKQDTRESILLILLWNFCSSISITHFRGSIVNSMFSFWCSVNSTNNIRSCFTFMCLILWGHTQLW